MAKDAKLAQKQLADLLFPVRSNRGEDDDGILNVPLNERRLQTETYDFTIATIFDLLRTNRIIVPEFQRKYVWNRNQASRLIESLIIQCPIPVIYLDQEDDGTLMVVDGNQRLMSIRLFLEGAYRLKGLKAYPDLNGLSFHQLDPRFKSHIENRTIRCITILKETHPQIKFDVFERLNTGAVQLNPQELRHGLYHGPLMQLLDELGEYGPWQAISGIGDDRRMRGAELILRFLALCFSLENYEKPLATFLNKFAQANRDGANNGQFATVFRSSVDGVQRLLGERAFHLLDDDGRAEKNFNAAIFDAQMVGFAHSHRPPESITGDYAREFLHRYRELQQNREFARAISASTSDPPLVRGRIAAVTALIAPN